MLNILKKWTSFIGLGLLLTLVITGCGGKLEEIRVGGKDYTEQFIMSEMIAILLEEKTNLNINLKNNIVDKILLDAIKSDEVDMFLDYTGTALTHLEIDPISDPKEVYRIVKKEYDEKYNIKWMAPYGFNNTYAMVVTQETAKKYDLKTISDMAKVAHQLTFGCTYAFTERKDGYPGLSKTYDFEFAQVLGMHSTLMYQALVEGNVDVISGFTTEGRIPVLDLVVLEDDKSFFPPYDATVIVRGEVLENHPQVEGVLRLLEGRIDDNKMAELNAKVDLDEREPGEVAREFLEEEGLL